MKRRSLIQLTPLRFIAALFVVVFHYPAKADILPPPFLDFGYQPVTFFYVLSGFILTYAHVVPNGMNLSLRDFMSRRFSRIAPAYYLGLVLSAPFVVKSLVPVDFLLVPTLLQSWWPPSALVWNPPAWSLSNEAFFYFFFPILILMTEQWQKAFCIAVASLIGASLVQMQLSGHPKFIYYFPLITLPQFILGIALGRIFLEGRRLHAAWFVLAILMLVLVITYKSSMPILGSALVLTPIFGLLIFSCASLPERICDTLVPTGAVLLGEASYALYILHGPVWQWWHHITVVKLHLAISPGIDFAVYLLGSTICSVATLLLIENPSRRALYNSLSSTAHVTSK